MKVLIHLNSQASWSTLCPGSFWTPLQICGIPSKSMKLNVASKANNTVYEGKAIRQSVSSDESSTIKKNYLVVHQPGGEGRGREGRWEEGVTTDLPAKWVTWRLLPQAKWVNYLLKSLELHKHANLFIKSKRQDSSPACLRLLKFGGQVLPSSLSQKCWIRKKCMKQFYDQEIK